ncbi:glycine zipper family protein [Ferrovibrio sp.]|uniref:glycine zipper family protein n=1 Tax=Ferrovibrio sp. TaxID=1917215 RepID=UPI00263952AE|nr:glycine zipper family protein [Ferrovibrio sp.]
MTMTPTTHPATARIATRLSALALVGLVAAGCNGMNDQQQRALSGGALGAAGGAVIGAVTGSTVTGALIGAAAGTAGGLLYHESEKSKKK